MPAQGLLGSQEHFKYSQSPLYSYTTTENNGIIHENDLVDIYHDHELSESISQEREMESLAAREKAFSMNQAVDDIKIAGCKMSEETRTSKSIFAAISTTKSASKKNDEKIAESLIGKYNFSLFEVDSGSDDSPYVTQSPTLDIPLLGNQQRRTYGLLYAKIFDDVRRKFAKVDRYNSNHEQIEDSIFQARSYTLLQESSHYSELPRPLRHVKKQTRKSSFLLILQLVFLFFLLKTLYDLSVYLRIETIQAQFSKDIFSSSYDASNSDSTDENFIVLILVGSIFFLVLSTLWRSRSRITRTKQIGNNNMAKMTLGIFLFIVSAVIVYF